VFDKLRGGVAGFLVLLWSARLTHSYFRRWGRQAGSPRLTRLSSPNQALPSLGHLTAPLPASCGPSAARQPPPARPPAARPARPAGSAGSLAGARTGASATWRRCWAPTGGGPPSLWPSCRSS
jgi:hypothetical protein